MTLRCVFDDANRSVFARSTLLYGTDAAGLMFQGFNVLFASQTVPGNSYRHETFSPGCVDAGQGSWMAAQLRLERIDRADMGRSMLRPTQK